MRTRRRPYGRATSRAVPLHFFFFSHLTRFTQISPSLVRSTRRLHVYGEIVATASDLAPLPEIRPKSLLVSSPADGRRHDLATTSILISLISRSPSYSCAAVLPPPCSAAAVLHH